MASANFINECKNPTYESRYGRIKIGEPAELTGDTISITDGQPHKVKDFKLSKLSTQNGTPTPDYPQEVKVVNGYRNLFDASIVDYSSSGIESKGDSNGNITCSGTLSGTAFNITDNNTVDFPAGKYAFSIQEPLPYNLKFRLEGTSVNYVNMSAGSKNLVINLSENKTKMRIYMDGLTTNTNINFTFKLMIVKSEQDLPYAPYGTNYVSNIIKTKNIFDYKTTTFSDISRVNIVAENDTLTITTTVTTTGNNLFFWTRIPDYLLENGATYTISSENVSGVSLSLKLQLRNKDGSNANKPQNFSIVYDDNYALYITSNIFGGGSTSIPSGSVAVIKNIQVEKGSSNSTYEPYKEKSIPIPLNNNFIGGIGNYKDQLLVDKDGHCYLNKKIGKKVFTGSSSETWYKTSYTFYIETDIGKVASLCSHFTDKGVNWTSSDTSNKGKYTITNVSGQFKCMPLTDMTIANFKTWLSNNNVSLYFVVATPQLIDLNYTVDIELYEGINIITNSENADMDIIYYKTVELNQSNKIQKFSIDDGCYIDGNIVGSVYAKQLNTQLIDALDNDIEDAECKVEVGLTYEDNNNNVTEYINLGKYIVDKPKEEQTENFSSFIAYDLLMQHLEEKYETVLDYDNNTITLGEVYAELCIRLGLIPVTTTFTNSTIEVEDNPFTNGESNRIALNSIAKVACSFVDIDYNNNKIDLKWLSNNIDYTYQKSDYSTLEGAKTIYGPVNSLVIKSSASDDENVAISDEQSIIENGEHQLVIIEDYFLYNAEKREAAITAIWDKVNGLTYTECSLTTPLGKPFHKIGDKIRIYTNDNEYIDSYILRHTFTYDGTFNSVIKCPVLTEQQIKTKQDISLQEKLWNTQIIVNKQNATITNLASRTKTLENESIKTNDKFKDYTPLSRTVDLETSVSDIQTDTYKKTEVKQILKGEFYDENNNQIVSEIVKTTSGTFDADGMLYEKSGSPVKTRINDVGTRTSTIDGDKTILFAGYVDENNTEYTDFKGQTIVATENVIVKNYFVMPEAHSRIEKYGNGGGMFYV